MTEKELEDLLLDVLDQACSEGDIIDSRCLSSYTEAIRELAQRGRLTIVDQYGRRVLAKRT